MLNKVKRRLYFLVATYFAFWAKLVLMRWRPTIVVITGSSGKTTALHLAEAQIGDKAIYSHHANGAIGIPFHILGLGSSIYNRAEWLVRAIKAPFMIFRKLPSQKLYVVEADCDRPNEGQFVSKLLKPKVTLWVSVYRTHTMNFERLVKSGQFKTHQQAVAYEFGYFIARTSELIVINNDQPDMVAQLSRVAKDVKVVKASAKNVSGYKLNDRTTSYSINGQAISVPGILPPNVGVTLQMINSLLDYLDIKLDPSYVNFKMPPGRSNIYKGKKNITIIDSTYNTGLGATEAILQLFSAYTAKSKWLVMGDMIELGTLEKEEHEALAKEILKVDAERVILLGPRIKRYTYPILVKERPDLNIDTFESPKEVLDFLEANIKGGEAIMFKGGRYLEGVIEQLLESPKDADSLVRREPFYVKRRQSWGLPR